MTGIQARYVIEQEMARRLTPGEELAIRLRYGLDGTPPMTLLEVGIRLGGMSKDGVRGLILRALRKLARPSWRGDLRRIR